MVIALFDPGHLAIDLGEDRRSTFPWTNYGVEVRRRRHEVAIVVSGLEPEPYYAPA
jgi:hypothetical protein